MRRSSVRIGVIVGSLLFSILTAPISQANDLKSVVWREHYVNWSGIKSSPGVAIEQEVTPLKMDGLANNVFKWTHSYRMKFCWGAKVPFGGNRVCGEIGFGTHRQTNGVYSANYDFWVENAVEFQKHTGEFPSECGRNEARGNVEGVQTYSIVCWRTLTVMPNTEYVFRLINDAALGPDWWYSTLSVKGTNDSVIIGKIRLPKVDYVSPLGQLSNRFTYTVYEGENLDCSAIPLMDTLISAPRNTSGEVAAFTGTASNNCDQYMLTHPIAGKKDAYAVKFGGSNLRARSPVAEGSTESSNTSSSSGSGNTTNVPVRDASASGVADSGSGLLASIYQYGGGVSPALPKGDPIQTMVVEKVDFNWNEGPILGTSLLNNTIIKFEGFITAPQSGNYVLTAPADDGIRIYIDDILVLDDWRDKAGLSGISSVVAFKASVPRAITIFWYENWGGANIRLEWRKSASGDPFELVPGSSLTYSKSKASTGSQVSAQNKPKPNTPTLSAVNFSDNKFNVAVNIGTGANIPDQIYLVAPKLGLSNAGKVFGEISGGVARWSLSVADALKGASIPFEIRGVKDGVESDALLSSYVLPRAESKDVTKKPEKLSNPKTSVLATSVIVTVDVKSNKQNAPTSAFLYSADLGIPKSDAVPGEIVGKRAVFSLPIQVNMVGKRSNFSVYAENEIGTSGISQGTIFVPAPAPQNVTVPKQVIQPKPATKTVLCSKGQLRRTFAASKCPVGWKEQK